MTHWSLPLESPQQWLEPTSPFLLSLSDFSRSTYAPNLSVRWWNSSAYRAYSVDCNKTHSPYFYRDLLNNCYIFLNPTRPTCSEVLVLPPPDMSVNLDAILILSNKAAITLLYLPFPHFVPLRSQLAQTACTGPYNTTCAMAMALHIRVPSLVPWHPCEGISWMTKVLLSIVSVGIACPPFRR